MGAISTGNNDSSTNSCGIPQRHAYTFSRVYTMTDVYGTEHGFLTFRNPWGTVEYTGEWSASDERWTEYFGQELGEWYMDSLKNTWNEYGFFITPKKYIDGSYDCFASFSIAYY